MASLYSIPKEIKEDNKVALNLNLKQLITCSVALAIDLLIYFTMKLPLEQMMGITLVLVGGALVCSSKTIDGVSVWQYCFDSVKRVAYHDNRRKYRTKNKVISSLNKRYSELKADDMKDKRIAKKIKAEQKRKRKKSTKLRAIY